MVAETTMKRKAAVSLLTSRTQIVNQGEVSIWGEIIERIRDGQLIPVISNSLRMDQIFKQLADSVKDESGDGDEEAITVEQLISQAWADEIGYPLADQTLLARVAQYNRVN